MTLKDLANHFDEVQDWIWDVDSYLNYVMSPLEKAMKEELKDDPRKEELLALLDFENQKLQELMDCFQRDLGKMKIRTRKTEPGCLLSEKVVSTYLEAADQSPSIMEKKSPQRLFIERRHYKRNG